MKHTSRLLFVVSLFGSWFGWASQDHERVLAIKPPATPLPDEAASRGVTKYSFIVYDDTRGRRDGTAIQYEHSLIIDSILAQIKKLAGTDSPVKFVL